jgi:predicted Zn-dependent peptidase
VQKVVLTELDSRERVVSEKVRTSVPSGSDSGSASAHAGERDDRAGVPHLNEHLLFEGSSDAPGDRGDVRRGGRRAERRHVPRAHRRAVTVRNG